MCWVEIMSRRVYISNIWATTWDEVGGEQNSSNIIACPHAHLKIFLSCVCHYTHYLALHACLLAPLRWKMNWNVFEVGWLLLLFLIYILISLFIYLISNICLLFTLTAVCKIQIEMVLFLTAIYLKNIAHFFQFIIGYHVVKTFTVCLWSS